MKIKLTLLLLLTTLFASAQTVVTISRNDTTKIEKTTGTGNAELIIKNQQRGVTNGIAYNRGNGWLGFKTLTESDIPSLPISKVTGLQDSLSKKENKVLIVGWGDSLTEGTGSTGDSTYLDNLSRLTGFKISNQGVSGETSTQIRTRFFANPQFWEYPTIIWVGRNNYLDTTTVKADIDAMIAALPHTDYLVMGVINSSWEPNDGNQNYAAIIAINNYLEATYGDHYIDIREYLVGQYDPTVGEDVSDNAASIPPSSLTSDVVHLNNTGYLKVAERITASINLLVPNSDDKSNSYSRITGNAFNVPTSGFGIEMFNNGGRSYISSFSRNTNSAIPLSIAYQGTPQTRINENGGNLNIGANTAIGFSPSYNTTYNFEVNGTGHFSGALTSPNLIGNNTGDETQASILNKIGDTGGGDLSGPLLSPTVVKFNNQLPSYYLDYTNLTNKPTGTLTTGRIPKATGANTLADGLISDNGSEVIVNGGPSETGWHFQVNGEAAFGTYNSTRIYAGSTSSTEAFIQARDLSTNRKLSIYASEVDINSVVTVATPTAAGHATTKAYVDGKILTTGSGFANGNGTTTITMSHSLGSTPTYYHVTATNAAAANISYVTADATSLIIHYTSAPPSGSLNLSYNFSYRP